MTGLVALALFALAADSAQAQRYGSPPVAQRAAYSSLSAGVRAGLNLATLYGDDVDEAGNRTGFSGGLFLTYNLTPVFAIQPEILFSAKGAEIDADGSSPMGVGEREYTFGYLELPMLARVNVPVQSPARPYLVAGPSLGIKLYGELDEEDLDETLKGSDLGMVVGGGLDFNLGARKLVLDARYTFGLNDVFDVSGDPEAKNGALTLSIGVGL
ncbi:MAG: porin family protein [Rhodothermales bacterium]